MRTKLLRTLASVIVAGALATPGVAPAQMIPLHADGNGYLIVPTQNTTGTSTLRAKVDRRAQTIQYELSYQDLKGDILQAHIHFGQPATNGDIVLFLCTNLGNTPPTATPAPLCPGTQEGTVTGVLRATDIVAVPFPFAPLPGLPLIQPANQLLPFANFDELVAALDAGATYTVVHTQAQPSGEVRGQVQHGGGH